MDTAHKNSVLVPAGVAALVSVLMFFVFTTFSDQASSYNNDEYYYDCNVAVIDVQGVLDTYTQTDATEPFDTPDDEYTYPEPAPSADSQYIADGIFIADTDPAIEAIVLTIDSPGGAPVAGEEIAEALKHAHKPTVALVRQEATSAAYHAATGADVIFAHRSSDVGSIGVTMSYYDTTKKDAQDGFTYIPLFAGTYKEILNPSDPLTAEERAILEDYLAKSHQDFIAQIAENRNMPVSAVEPLANGLAYLASDALQLGLIDYIGSVYDVKDYLAQQLGYTSPDDIGLCLY